MEQLINLSLNSFNKKELLTKPDEKKLLFHIYSAYINDYSGIDVYAFGRNLVALGELVQELAKPKVEEEIEETGDSSVAHDYGLFTLSVTKKYDYLDNPRIQKIKRLIEEAEKMIQPHKEAITTLNKNIKTIEQQLVQNGEVLELDPIKTIKIRNG